MVDQQSDWRRLIPAVSLIVMLFATSGYAMEGGQSPSLRGYRDFMVGVLPWPGVLVRQDVYFYRGTERSTIPQGKLTANLRATAGILGVTAITPYKILGGHYAFGLRGAVSDISADQTVSRPGGSVMRVGALTALNDMVVSPIIVGWHRGNVHWNIGASVWVPVGVYDKARLGNAGKNYWSAAPHIAVTYLDPTSGWEFSAASIYVMSAQNTATNYRSGNLLQVDYAIGNAITPTFKLGMVGYWQHQTSDDSGIGAIAGPRRLRVSGLGPAASLSFSVNNIPISIVAKYYREFSTQNTTQGDAGSLSLRAKF